MLLKKNYIVIFFSILFICCSCTNEDINKSEEQNVEKVYSKDICKETIAPFYYESNKKNVKTEIKKMCTCLWGKLPENGWERKVSSLLYEGKDIGWKIKSFSTIFEYNYTNCAKELSLNE